jgi:hypothetical protein
LAVVAEPGVVGAVGFVLVIEVVAIQEGTSRQYHSSGSLVVGRFSVEVGSTSDPRGPG